MSNDYCGQRPLTSSYSNIEPQVSIREVCELLGLDLNAPHNEDVVGNIDLDKVKAVDLEDFTEYLSYYQKKHYKNITELDYKMFEKINFWVYEIRKAMKEALNIEYVNVYYEEKSDLLQR